MAESLRSKNCPRDSLQAGVASLLVGVAWEVREGGAGERCLRAIGALLGLGVHSTGGLRAVVGSAGGSAIIGGLLARVREEAASPDSF
jgi:hypothetical protein